MRGINYFTDHKTNYKHYLILLFLCLLSYWPLSFGIFSVKNDAIHYFLPYRFNISEAIRNGEWPFWSPYIYLGYPVYGDMQSGAWNPVVWLFSFFSRYDVTVFHYENLFYIFLAGIGMYKLTYHCVKHSLTALLIAACYMLSGFMLSGQLINWLASAAFIPFVFLYYLRLWGEMNYTNVIKTGIAAYLLFSAGYPSFFIFIVYILFAYFLIKCSLAFIKRMKKTDWFKILSAHFFLLLIFIGLSLPAIISYFNLLPYYQRGNGIPFSEAIINSFDWQYFLSFIFPSSIKATDIVSSTDITFRNVFIGIFPVIILIALPPKLSRRNILLLLLVIFSILFSLGDATPVRKLCYDFIPLMDTFRHPSQVRLFLILALLLLTAPGLQKLLTFSLSEKKIRNLKNVLIVFTLMVLATTIYFFSTSSWDLSYLQNDKTSYKSIIKNLLENLNLQILVSINGILQLFFLSFLIVWIYMRRKNIFLLSFAWIANLFLFAQLVLPITFVSKTSAKDINSFIHHSPEGFPVNNLEKTIRENSEDATDHFDKIALSYFYNKKIGISKITNSPSFLAEQEQFLHSPSLYTFISSYPLYYLADTIAQLKDTGLLKVSPHKAFAFLEKRIDQKISLHSDDNVILEKLSSNKFYFKTSDYSSAYLVLTQNYHDSWKVSIDGKNQKIYKTNLSFMGCIIPPGKHNIEFSFKPEKTVTALWFQFATVLFLLFFSIFYFVKNKRSIR